MKIKEKQISVEIKTLWNKEGAKYKRVSDFDNMLYNRFDKEYSRDLLRKIRCKLGLIREVNKKSIKKRLDTTKRNREHNLKREQYNNILEYYKKKDLVYNDKCALVIEKIEWSDAVEYNYENVVSIESIIEKIKNDIDKQRRVYTLVGFVLYETNNELIITDCISSEGTNRIFVLPKSHIISRNKLEVR